MEFTINTRKLRQKIVAIYCFLFMYTPLIKERFMEKYIIPLNNKFK